MTHLLEEASKWEEASKQVNKKEASKEEEILEEVHFIPQWTPGVKQREQNWKNIRILETFLVKNENTVSAAVDATASLFESFRFQWSVSNVANRTREV